MGYEPVYRGILAVDIERFSRGDWTDPIRARLRAQLHQLLDHALSQAGVEPSQTYRSDTGDGVLLLAADVPTTRLLHPLVTAFAEQLASANRSASAGERLRVRLAVHAGEVLPDPYGHTGQSLNHVSRLLDAGAGRMILDAIPEADAVLLVSEQLYDSVVKHAYEGIDPAAYQPVWVSEKETSTRAWVHLPGMSSQPELDRLPRVPVAPSHGPPTQPTPRQLPNDIGEFTGRQQELDRLVKVAGTPSGVGSAAIIAIDGMGGVGKSALAIHAAHQLADQFLDGQLYLELRGATPGLVPLPPIAALDRLLQSVGVPAGEVPTEVDAAAAYWRSLAAGRRLLVVLDNAATAVQVAPLLPASASCAVLITSRRMLSALGGVARVHLATLSAAEAVELLAKLAGPERVAAEPAAAAELAELCGYLPLALRLSGARAARRPSWPLRVLADRLVAARRLDELADEHLGVRASMQVSYRELHDSALPRDQRAARAFRLLGILDTPDVSVAIAARLLDEPELEAEQALELLVDAQLLQTPSLGRYRLHDLLRLYAREEAAHFDPEPTRLAALGRVLDCYLATARRTSQLLQPADQRRAGSSIDQAAALPLPDRAAAIAWLDAEQANLVALVRQAAGLPDALAARAVDLVQALFWGMDTRAQYRTQRVLGELTLPIARRLNDHSGRGHLLTDLGGADWRLGRFEAARACLEEALTAFEQLGDLHGQARALNNLGVLHSRQGRWDSAHGCYERALELHRQRGDQQSQAVVLSNLGCVAQDKGELEQASSYHRQALAICREVGDGKGEAVALLNLGEASLRQGQLEAAIGNCEHAIRLASELDDHDTQGQALNTRGEAYRRAGDPARAVSDQQQAVAIARDTGDQISEADALWRLGLALQDLRQPQRATACWQQALSIFEALDAPQAKELRSLVGER